MQRNKTDRQKRSEAFNLLRRQCKAMEGSIKSFRNKMSEINEPIVDGTSIGNDLNSFERDSIHLEELLKRVYWMKYSK